MSSQFRDISESAFLAQSAYALFTSPEAALAALTRAEKADFSNVEARRFLGASQDPHASAPQGFELRNHQPDDAAGFSASVFFDRSSNRYVLSIRGTAGVVDLAEDFHRIAGQGYAGAQAVSLYRYYRRLTTPAGQPVRYSDQEVALLNSMQQGAPLSGVLLPAPLMRQMLAQDVGATPAAGGGGTVIPAGTPIIVAGHSLGGHLALLFGRLFPGATEHIYTYNAPGFGPQGEVALRQLGIPQLQASVVTNIAAFNGNEAIANIPFWSKPGENVAITTENGDSSYRHAMVPLADSLALYGAFATLSPELGDDPADVSGIISAASPYSEQSLESVLDALSDTLGVDTSSTLIARFVADVEARDSYYENLYRTLDARVAGHDYRIVSLVGESAGDLASMAREDVAVRFALSRLAPFAATGADFSEFDDSFSGEWIAGRAEWLEAMLESNAVDRVFGLSGADDNVLFRDIDSGRTYSTLNGPQGIIAMQVAALADRSRIQDFLATVPYNRTVVFGSDSEGDQLLGLTGDDRLLGAAGDDRLDGADGDDILDGGAGDDTLLGGAGDDTLYGGEGVDRLEGGAGDDIYVFASDLDADTIVDSDGWIHVGAGVLAGGFGPEGGNFQSSDGRFNYEFSGDLASTGTLVINGTLRVEGFRNGDLGIHLRNIIEEPDPWVGEPTVVLRGDFDYGIPEDGWGPYADWDEFDNLLLDPRIGPAPGRNEVDFEFPGTPGSTHFIMGGGDDQVQDVLGGDDHLELGPGADRGWGGRGNDLVEGGPGRDLVAGGKGDDILYAGTVATRDADLDDSAMPTLSTEGDLLSGGEGNDAIHGDAESNVIEGGPGADWISAGAGDDWIGADSNGISGNELYGTLNSDHDSVNRIIDRLFSRFSPLTYALNPSTVFGLPATVSASGGYADTSGGMNVEGWNDWIDAGSGNDTIYGGSGDDIIYAGAGNDYVEVGTGADTVFAGPGNDAVYARNDAVDDYVDGGEGNDQVITGAGDDTLFGGSGNDLISSFGGNDVFFGGAGDDFFSGGGIGGTIRICVGGGSGADYGIITSGSLIVDVMGDVSPGEVTIERVQRLIPARDGGGLAFETVSGIQFSMGTNGDSLFVEDLPAFYPYVPKSVVFTDGTLWDDAYVRALLEPVESPGASGSIAGSAQGDLAYGTAGADTFTSSQGDDWLLGGAGNDVYEYAASAGFDLIEDTDSTQGNSDTLRFGADVAVGDVSVFAVGSDYVLTVGSGGVRIRGGRTLEGAIERVEFSDTTSWSAADLGARAEILPDNRAPDMPALLGRIDVDPGSALDVTIPGNAVSDPDRFDSLSYFAVTAQGDPLPEWLAFDPATLTFSGTPGAGDAGPHEILLIAADASGAASFGSLTIAVGGDAPTPVPAPASDNAAPAPVIETADSGPAEMQSGTDIQQASIAPAPIGRDESILDAAPAPLPAADAPRAGLPADPQYREMQPLFDVLLQVGRTNLGERYAEAIREFEERRLEREEAPPPPPPSDDEVAAWNSAMHAWHDRNPGFAETDLGGGDGTWSLGWGLPGPGDNPLGGPASAALPGLANPLGQARLGGAAATPMLGEGLRDLR